MSWLDNIYKQLYEVEQHVINDAKSPSGKPHVGALRGVLIHDAVYKFLKSKGVNVKYIFGSDDYDPFDELPAWYPKEMFEKYLGMPLSEVPAPPDSEYSDLAMYFISDFFKIFDELKVEAEKYYMRDYYKSGFFNEAIDIVLRKADKIREIYWKVSKSERPADWYPLQVRCEKCGKIGTTQVIDYDGKEVTYICKEDHVSWAKGCGYKGKVSPFDGNAKMPYKVEWPAKWKYFGVTIEGAGTDHNTKGGSRDIANAISREVFGYRPPINIPYGFFLMGGAKMSSSKGIGATARDMADFLPPEILRFLMLYTQPKRAINFEPNEKYIIKLFNDFDKIHNKYIKGEKLEDYEEQFYKLSQVFYDEKYDVVEFSQIVTMIQLPHIDIYQKAEEILGHPLSETEKKVLETRIRAAKFWLKNLAPEKDKIELQQTLPEKAKDLTPEQKAFLRLMADYLKDNPKATGDEIQSAIFNVARLVPLSAKDAFKAIYIVLINKEQGPKAGTFIAFLDRDFVINRFNEVLYDKTECWKRTGITPEKFEEWFADNKDKIQNIEISYDYDEEASMGAVQIVVKLDDGKFYMKRVIFEDVDENEFFQKAEYWTEQLGLKQ